MIGTFRPYINGACGSVMRFTHLSIIGICRLFLANALGQSPPALAEPAVLAKQGISWAEKGRCREALPILKKSMARRADKRLKYQASMANTHLRDEPPRCRKWRSVPTSAAARVSRRPTSSLDNDPLLLLLLRAGEPGFAGFSCGCKGLVSGPRTRSRSV